jgi:iron complex outermembrane receptor protein
MNRPFVRKAIVLAIATGVQASAAMAQNDTGFALEEIVVTAQKREQSLQDVPSTVNAIQADALTDLKLFNFSDLEQVTPGLDMRNIDGRAGSIALRGVDFNPNTGAAAAVDVYWNDVTLGSNASGGVFQEMFDLGRVEVLRGPQGTLQGRTSPAGAVAIHTARPDMEEIEGYVRTTFTSNDGNNTQFGASLPIIPGSLSLRVAGVYNDRELNDEENVLDGDVSDTHTDAGRLTLVWEPSDELSAELVYQYVENDLSKYDVLVGSSALGQDLPNLRSSDLMGINPQADTYRGRFENTSLKFEWEVAGHQLTFVSGYSEVGSRRNFDNASGNSETGFTALHPLYPQLGVSGSQLNDPQSMLDQNYASSQELRLASMEGDTWDYTLGIYYGNESGYFYRPLMREQRVGQGASLFFDTEVQTPFNMQSYGAFVHNIFYLSEQLTTQVGIRWQRQERNTYSALYLSEDVFAPPAPPAQPVFQAGTQLAELVDDNRTNEKWTGSVSVQYAFADLDMTAYATAASSFRPGGSTIASADLGEFTHYEEEDSWSLEAGVKSSWLDNRLRLNGAVFHQDYSDYIGRASRILISSGANAGGITTNGDALIQGVELDFEYLLSADWRLAGGVSYVEAEYQDGAEVPCNGVPIPQGATAASCDVGGLELGVQPRVSANISSDYVIPMDSFEAYVKGLYKFVGRRTDVDASSGDLGAYATLDLHLGLREAGGVWDVSLFARNLFDKSAMENVQPEFRTLSRQGTGYRKVQVLEQRTIGLSATYNF